MEWAIGTIRSRLAALRLQHGLFFAFKPVLNLVVRNSRRQPMSPHPYSVKDSHFGAVALSSYRGSSATPPLLSDFLQPPIVSSSGATDWNYPSNPEYDGPQNYDIPEVPLPTAKPPARRSRKKQILFLLASLAALLVSIQVMQSRSPYVLFYAHILSAVCGLNCLLLSLNLMSVIVRCLSLFFLRLLILFIFLPEKSYVKTGWL